VVHVLDLEVLGKYLHLVESYFLQPTSSSCTRPSATTARS
jgi:hypothetical protein